MRSARTGWAIGPADVGAVRTGHRWEREGGPPCARPPVRRRVALSRADRPVDGRPDPLDPRSSRRTGSATGCSTQCRPRRSGPRSTIGSGHASAGRTGAGCGQAERRCSAGACLPRARRVSAGRAAARRGGRRHPRDHRRLPHPVGPRRGRRGRLAVASVSSGAARRGQAPVGGPGTPPGPGLARRRRVRGRHPSGRRHSRSIGTGPASASTNAGWRTSWPGRCITCASPTRPSEAARLGPRRPPRPAPTRLGRLRFEGAGWPDRW